MCVVVQPLDYEVPLFSWLDIEVVDLTGVSGARALNKDVFQAQIDQVLVPTPNAIQACQEATNCVTCSVIPCSVIPSALIPRAVIMCLVKLLSVLKRKGVGDGDGALLPMAFPGTLEQCL